MAIIDIVKYEGTPNVLAWKYPKTNLSTWTQIIVNESQEAVLYRGGQSLDWFGPGRHTLDTANIPLLNKFLQIPFGSKSPFTVEVWYINKVSSLDVKWGTPTPIQLQDPKYNIFVPVRAYGQFGIRITNAKLFLEKLVGTLPVFSQEEVTKYFKGAYLTVVKDCISSYLIKRKVPILEINAYINEISDMLKGQIKPTFDEYGIELVSFYINDISLPENDNGVIKLKDALAKKAEMEIIGYTYAQERSFDTLEGIAKNEGSSTSQFVGAGMGVGMGVGMGANMGGVFGDISKNLNINQTVECFNCNGQMSINDKFCPLCGSESQSVIKTIKCTNCGGFVNANQKFCSDCGSSMTQICLECNSIIIRGLKYCPECGKEVEVKEHEEMDNNDN